MVFALSRRSSLVRPFVCLSRRWFKTAGAENASIDILRSIERLKSAVDWDRAESKLQRLQKQQQSESLWENAAYAQKIFQEAATLQSQLSEVKTLVSEHNDLCQLLDLAEQSGQHTEAMECTSLLMELKEKAHNKLFRHMLDQESDRMSVVLEVHAGAGGTDSMDWADMLLRMYTRWAEQKELRTELVDKQHGDVAGIRSAILKIETNHSIDESPDIFDIRGYVYGVLKGEAGVHRLVRLSPYGSTPKRETSFASVAVYPLPQEAQRPKISPSDLRIDTYRASGAGGQHVNKTESAVRITHIPSGIVTASQEDRSQHRNKTIAMDMLYAKLYKIEVTKQQATRLSHLSSLGSNEFGSQIRNYVLHPYKLIRDLRSGHQSSNVEAVLDGNLDPFLLAVLTSNNSQSSV
eukprot:GILK01011893.1.p1 GENE.GILK01011893.1~~GILK01011893.1.p1  ORF type:complete len:407 (-),score=59.73 GILK01011893.1:88-1308(-)